LSATHGGWLDRIASGTSVAFLEPEEGEPPVNQLHLTPRMIEIGRWMLDDGPTWATARDIALGSGVPLGTVQPMIVNRFEPANWIRSERQGDSHVRAYQLTEEGRRGIQEALERPVAPTLDEPRGEASDLDDAERERRREAARAEVVDADAEPSGGAARAAALRRLPEQSGRVWTMSELRKQDPRLAEVVRDNMGKPE
jgi:DNA-binding PadR family transcriptional regulator